MCRGQKTGYQTLLFGQGRLCESGRDFLLAALAVWSDYTLPLCEMSEAGTNATHPGFIEATGDQ